MENDVNNFDITLDENDAWEKPGNGPAWIVRALTLAVVDVILIAASYFLGLMLRFDFKYSQIPLEYIEGFVRLVPFFCGAALAVFYFFRLYHSIWRFASFSELIHLTGAWSVLQVLIVLFTFVSKVKMPWSFFIIGFVLGYALTTASRFGYRFLRFARNSIKTHGREERIMVVGAGQSGKDIIHEYVTSQFLKGKVCCVIDDNPVKKGRFLDGVPIVGNRRAIPEMAQKFGITKIILAIPTLDGESRKDIVDICSRTGIKTMVVPGVYQLVDGSVSVSKLRDVQIEDLLGREAVQVNMDSIQDYIKGKVVLVTGGGGSIGSELCSQIAKLSPKQLVIFDIYENNAYWIQQELKERFGSDLNFVTLIGSVRNTARINSVIKQYRPDIVFHAAAHKHVPLMEESPHEAIKNNVFGTYKTAQAALKYGVQKFVLISTDKAVNPTNIMGASKRICEMVIQMMDRKSASVYARGKCDRRTSYVAVRFGNVLGSNGSVIPLFKKQIADGGPVTVTDKNIIRYFMTIPEAVSLVLQAGAFAFGGEIFVLDMGNPVKIDDMARNLIRLAGYTPDVDIKIEYTGLRPGEKLFEERLMDEEGLKKTANNLISVAEPIKMDDEAFEKSLALLQEAADDESSDIKQIVASIVPTYKVGK